jgi:predicted fused transcriptional regulator/phosphomethylpyrimidine kinase/predicted transcriptional regulator
MRPPCEVVVKQLLPILRALVAEDLMTRYGWTQSKVAEQLGVTQPAVSSYLSLLNKKAWREFDLEELRSFARRTSSGLERGELTLSETVRSVCELCIKLKSGGIVCTLHKKRVPELRRESCEVCLDLFSGGIEGVGERIAVLEDIKKAVSLIEDCEEFMKIMPEVRVNIVMAIPNAKTVSEVAGIPGRIIEVRRRARAFMEPEFGSSFHLAKVLLTAMEKDGSVRAVTNIKYDSSVDEALRKLGLRFSCFDRVNLPEEALKGEVVAAWGVKQMVEKFRGVPDVIVDMGEHGIEPVSYVFGKSAVEAARKVIQIAKALSS